MSQGDFNFNDPTRIPYLKIEGGGMARSYSGTTMEKILASLFHLAPGVTNGTAAVCPDAFTWQHKPVEMKSLRRGNKLVVYDWRLKKDFDDTLYFIGCHKAPRCPGTLEQIWTGFSLTLNEVLIVPVTTIRRLSVRYPLKKIKTNKTKSGDRNGYQRRGYKEGYRNIPYEDLMKEMAAPMPFEIKTTLHDLEFSVKVRLALPEMVSDLINIPF